MSSSFSSSSHNDKTNKQPNDYLLLGSGLKQPEVDGRFTEKGLSSLDHRSRAVGLVLWNANPTNGSAAVVSRPAEFGGHCSG